MKIETALKRVREKYDKAKTLEFVKNPVAWALYQVWKETDQLHQVDECGRLEER